MLTELTAEQVQMVDGGARDSYFDIGYAIGSFSATYGPYSMGATSYFLYSAVRAIR